MAVLTIGGKDFPAALNLRSARFFQEATGQSIYAFFSSLGEMATKGENAAIDLSALDAGVIARLIWSLANAKPNGPDFDFVESSVGIEDFPLLVEQATQLIPTKLKLDSPQTVDEATSQPTGSSSGPSATEG